MADFLEIAFEMAGYGWHVFPVAPGEKVPAIPKSKGGRGVLDATDDEDQICSWAAQYPTANVGIACGERSGLLVIDIDTHHGGLQSVADLRTRGLRLPPTVSSRTPNDGWHLFYSYDRGPRNSKSLLAPGIDVRTDGGYVVAAGSVLADGRAYRWYTRPLGSDLPRLPAWALQKLRPREETPFYTERREPGDIEALVAWMENAPPGERNSCLHWAAMRAGEAVLRGEISQPEALADMIQAGMRVGLDQAEAGKTARSGIRRGMRR